MSQSLDVTGAPLKSLVMHQ